MCVRVCVPFWRWSRTSAMRASVRACVSTEWQRLTRSKDHAAEGAERARSTQTCRERGISRSAVEARERESERATCTQVSTQNVCVLRCNVVVSMRNTDESCVCVRGKLVVTRRTGIGARSQERRPYGHSVGYELNGRWPTVDGRRSSDRGAQQTSKARQTRSLARAYKRQSRYSE